VVSGGFPCQDISSAGQRKGIDGEHSGLWREMARIISETRPVFVLIENSPHLRTRGLVRVLKDLDGMGYNTARGVFGAEDCGAPHPRKRMWIVANIDDGRKRTVPGNAEVASTSTADGIAWPVQVADLTGVKMGARGFAREHVELAVSEGCARMSANSSCVGRGQGRPRRLVAGMERQQELPFQEPPDANGSPLREQPGRGERQNGHDKAKPGGVDWWPLDLVSGMDDGVASRVERVRATGNGQVPTVVRLAWETLRPWA
jgi:DNA (cytosine-5)-methyltransferase 1